MSTVLFSIIIPGYNRVEPLKYTLCSAAAAIANLPGSAEIILVDDGSEPPLTAQLNAFKTNATLRHVRQTNQGSIAARLTGLQLAEGVCILFLDSDDLIHPDKLVRHFAAMNATSADVVYDDLAVARLGPNHTADFSPSASLPVAAEPADFFLRVQPAPHSPTYRRTYLQSALASPTVKLDRRMDPAGDVWLYYNLARHPARIVKIDAALTATGPHDDARYSQHWENLGVAALLIAESFMAGCSTELPGSASARRAAGEAAFRSWRRLPRGFSSSYARRLLALWQQAPHGPNKNLGGPFFRFLAAFLGSTLAGRLLRLRNHTYASCRTLADDELSRLLPS
jgi:hypothetical protein